MPELTSNRILEIFRELYDDTEGKAKGRLSGVAGKKRKANVMESPG
jgi:hypothetical protein